MIRLGPRGARILAALAENPGGLSTAEIARICDDGTAQARARCGSALYAQAIRGRVRRAGRAPARHARAILWQAVPEMESRRLALLRRKAAALTRMEEGIKELEQAEREIEAAGFNSGE